MKPIALIVNALQNSTQRDGLCLDLFLGSGSTLIACEKTNRICYGMEIDAKYTDVIIKRWEDFTGEKAVKLQ
jgi:DNA modification methylase